MTLLATIVDVQHLKPRKKHRITIKVRNEQRWYSFDVSKLADFAKGKTVLFDVDDQGRLMPGSVRVTSEAELLKLFYKYLEMRDESFAKALSTPTTAEQTLRLEGTHESN